MDLEYSKSYISEEYNNILNNTFNNQILLKKILDNNTKLIKKNKKYFRNIFVLGIFLWILFYYQVDNKLIPSFILWQIMSFSSFLWLFIFDLTQKDETYEILNKVENEILGTSKWINIEKTISEWIEDKLLKKWNIYTDENNIWYYINNEYWIQCFTAFSSTWWRHPSVTNDCLLTKVEFNNSKLKLEKFNDIIIKEDELNSIKWILRLIYKALIYSIFYPIVALFILLFVSREKWDVKWIYQRFNTIYDIILNYKEYLLSAFILTFILLYIYKKIKVKNSFKSNIDKNFDIYVSKKEEINKINNWLLEEIDIFSRKISKNRVYNFYINNNYIYIKHDFMKWFTLHKSYIYRFYIFIIDLLNPKIISRKKLIFSNYIVNEIINIKELSDNIKIYFR